MTSSTRNTVRGTTIPAFITAAVLSCIAVPARADIAAAWMAAKHGLPRDVTRIVAFDPSVIQSTQLFRVLLHEVFNKTSEYGQFYDTLRDLCKIDPLAAIHGVVVATDDQDHGAVYLSLSGIDQDKLSLCLERLEGSMRDGATEPSFKRDGNTYRIAMTSGNDVYFTWFSRDVIAGSIQRSDKGLMHWTNGHGGFAGSRVAGLLAKVDMSGMAWFAGTVPGKLLGSVIVSQYGSVAFTDGRFVARSHWTSAEPGQAAVMAATLQGRLDKLRAWQQGSARLADIVKAIAISSRQDDIIIESHIAERDLMALVPLLSWAIRLARDV